VLRSRDRKVIRECRLCAFPTGLEEFEARPAVEKETHTCSCGVILRKGQPHCGNRTHTLVARVARPREEGDGNTRRTCGHCGETGLWSAEEWAQHLAADKECHETTYACCCQKAFLTSQGRSAHFSACTRYNTPGNHFPAEEATEEQIAELSERFYCECGGYFKTLEKLNTHLKAREENKVDSLEHKEVTPQVGMEVIRAISLRKCHREQAVGEPEDFSHLTRCTHILRTKVWKEMAATLKIAPGFDFNRLPIEAQTDLVLEFRRLLEGKQAEDRRRLNAE
jgi:hypothetical protein